MASPFVPLEERTIAHRLRRHADCRPDRPFLTIARRSLTFSQAWEQCEAIARAYAKRGIGDGSRVALMLPNCLEFVVGWFAAALAGAAGAMVNPTFKGMVLETLLRDLRPHAIVIHAAIVPVLGSIDPALLPRHLFVVGEMQDPPELPDVEIAAFDELRAGASGVVLVEPDFRRIALIGYTSGTTGPSKGVLLSGAASFCSPLSYTRAVGMTEDDSIFAPLPLFHAQASVHGVMSSLVIGTHITLDEKFSASRYWDRAAEAKATIGMLVTAFTSVLLAQPKRPSDRAHGLRVVFNVKYSEEFERRFAVRTATAFAMTEVGHLLNTAYPDRRPGSVGRACEDWELRLVDAEDRPVARCEPGELVCRPRSPHIMMNGYLNRPEATLESFRNLWFHTGDVLREDEDGFFYFLDRKKDRIRRMGENVSSLEVEVQVVAHPAVAECAVLPYPEKNGEDDIRAVVILHPGMELPAPELYAWLKEKLPKFMLPRYLEIVDTIPRNGTGKIEKHKLVAQGLSPGVWDVAQAG